MFRFILIVALSLGFAATGSAHRFSAPDAALDAYLANGGTLDSICGDTKHENGDCEICRLTLAVGLAGVSRENHVAVLRPAYLARHDIRFVLAFPYDPSQRDRAPPVA